MNLLNTILEYLAIDKITSGYEEFQQGGNFFIKVIIPLAESIAKNPITWVVGLLIIKAIYKRCK